METDGSITQSGCSSDNALSSSAEYNSPRPEQLQLRTQIHGEAAACGADYAESDVPPSKKLKLIAEGTSDTMVRDSVDLCPLQREVLDRVVSTIDRDNTSIVITNPQKKGA